ELAWQAWPASPLLGHGTGAFGLIYQFDDEPAWIGNLELHLLYDDGLLGLIGFVGLWIWTALRVARATRQASSLRRRRLGIGLIGALGALFVAYQTTEGSWLGFTWWYLALALAYSTPRRLTRSDADSEPELLYAN